MSADRLIKFPCRCGHPFALPGEEAGGLVQCPKCGRLNDVPSFSDLDSLSADGTLLLTPAETPKPRDRVSEAGLHFRRGTTDDHGSEIDLRNSLEDLADVGAPPEVDEIPLAGEDARPKKPKYDPETGELIRPIPVAKRPDLEQATDVPVAARALNYTSGDVDPVFSPRRIMMEILFPINMIVLLTVLVTHVLALMTILAVLFGFFIVAPVAILFVGIIIAHYGNTLEDTGPDARDELPRLLRQMGFGEDLWAPFWQACAALAICYYPAYFAWTRSGLEGGANALLGGAIALAGSILFPAVYLTLRTSGTINNLRPDRLLNVIRAAGGRYALSVLLLLATLAAYVVCGCGLLLMAERYFMVGGSSAPVRFISRAPVAFPLMLIAIYLAHFFAWHLGMIYRAHHANFGWVLQAHVSKRREEEAARAAAVRAMRRKPRYVQPKDPPAV